MDRALPSTQILAVTFGMKHRTTQQTGNQLRSDSLEELVLECHIAFRVQPKTRPEDVRQGSTLLGE
jgi:hypothetical protein